MEENTFSQLFQRLLQTEKERNLAKIKQNMLEALTEERQEQAAFEARLYYRWKKALDLFETILLLVLMLTGNSFMRNWSGNP